SSPMDALEAGIGFLPEDRLKQGLVLDWEIFRNISLSALERFSRHGFMHDAEERQTAKELAEKLEVKATSIYDKAATLSGGNQQKLIVAKLLTGDMKILILDEPTKGVDVGAKTAIYRIMNSLAEAGYGIIMISSEMPEVIGMSDRIVVMREGRVTAIMETKTANQQAILEASMSIAKNHDSEVHQ
ncbi:MAG: ATP-binding cassette domain-containing protein, partial [Spirochaetia bacterium]|nr:ATP-binding cassette domain-containing protein [Spirochaetia bacterium]